MWSIARRVVTVESHAFGLEDHAVAACTLQPHEGLLADVLGIADAAGHPIGDLKGQPPLLLEWLAGEDEMRLLLVTVALSDRVPW